MNKSEFVDQIAAQHKITKIEADKTINIFTSSVTSALGEGKEITLVGFGKFYSSQVKARQGRNPRTGDVIHIEAYVQPKFSSGQALKNACNKE